MTTDVTLNLTPISEAAASPQNFWPFVAICVMIGVLWLIVWFSLKMFTMLRQVNHAVNNSEEDSDTAYRGVPLREMVKTGFRKLDGDVAAVKKELDHHRAEDSVVINQLIRSMKKEGEK